MAKLNLSQAAKVTGKNRTTIWRHINSGKLSAERNRDGLPFVDTSELIRVYGELTSIATDSSKKKSHGATLSYDTLIETVELLRKEQMEMRLQIVNLTNRLSYIPFGDDTPEVKLNSGTLDSTKTKPEDDPDWPLEIKSFGDMARRNEIRKKHSTNT
jgi:hypothetical protein